MALKVLPPEIAAAATMSAILRDEPPPVADIRRNLPRQFGRIVNRCLQKHPDDRES